MRASAGQFNQIHDGACPGGGRRDIETAFSVLSLREQFLPANINFAEPDPNWKFEVVGNRSRAARVNYVLSNSIGFGGTNATLILKRV